MAELQLAAELGVQLVGINNRNTIGGVANAIGSAIPKVSGTYEQLIDYNEIPRDEALANCRHAGQDFYEFHFSTAISSLYFMTVPNQLLITK